MKKFAFRAHPITIFYLIRSFWIVFVAPPIRVIIQYVTNGDARIILFSETLAISLVVLFAVFSWALTKITVTDDKIMVEKGFLVKSCNVISLSNVSCMYAKRSLADIIFMSASLYVKSESDAYQRNSFKIKIKTSDLGKIFGENTAKTISPVKSRRNFFRSFIMPMWIALIILAVLLMDFGPKGLAALLLIDVYYAVNCYHDYAKGQIGIEDNVIITGSKGLMTYRFLCSKENIAVIKISQTPADRTLNTCKIKMIEHAKGAKGIKVTNVGIKEAVETINKEFDINVNV